MTGAAAAVLGTQLAKAFRGASRETVQALRNVSFHVPRAALTALVGPDGSGKTTLIRTIAGLLRPDAGRLSVLGFDVTTHTQAVQDLIGYMPQTFGLYEDLTVQENVDLYADLHGVGLPERSERCHQLLAMTGLTPFRSRLAGHLSGGMKQKLGIACTLIRTPELLLLDEPTVGIDPLSRRDLWTMVRRLVDDHHLTVLFSTSYLEEAERCRHVIVLHNGSLLREGAPQDIADLAAGRVFVASSSDPARSLQARLLHDPALVDAVPEAGKVRIIRAAAPVGGVDLQSDGSRGIGCEFVPVPSRFDDGFMMLLRETETHQFFEPAPAPSTKPNGELVVEASDLVRRFGGFTAVNNIGFRVQSGTIFGLLGPNGAGKTTTFRMLCGLLPTTSGTLRVAGLDLRHGRKSARRRIGYVAQKFSLYGALTVTENLDFFAGLYGLRGRCKRNRLDWALHEFQLAPFATVPSSQLPGGYRQRLAMAAALLHEPDILFLDEPTSGADPLARREFWRRITNLVDRGVTAIVTTHFMEEAEYCDQLVILDGGTILAQGRPSDIRSCAVTAENPSPSMEDAFVDIVSRNRLDQSHNRSER
ncbi:ATP-binding cassette domain-containing protein [Rhodopseudomonas palustris]|uniref:ABC transporter related n=1 Tax=Rhodopseudomonas palustris (strain BisB18) TaxID=316056 RepID=Q212V3_RHOPB